MKTISFTKNLIISEENGINIDVDSVDNKQLFLLLNFCVKNEKKLFFDIKEDASASCQKLYEYIKLEFTKEDEV